MTGSAAALAEKREKAVDMREAVEREGKTWAALAEKQKKAVDAGKMGYNLEEYRIFFRDSRIIPVRSG